MALYITFDKTRKEYRYQRPVNGYSGLLGRKLFREWLGTDKKKAEARARELATAHDRLFASLEALTPEQIEYATSHGGVYGLNPPRALLEAVRKDLDLMSPIKAPLGGLSPRMAALQELASLNKEARAGAAKIDHTKPQWGMSVEDLMRLKLDGMQESLLDQSERSELELAKTILLKAEPQTAKFSFTGLVDLWQNATGAERREEHERTARRLGDVLGNVDYRSVKREDVITFRDTLEGEGTPYKALKKHLERVHAMFAAAVSRGVMPDNPAHDVSMNGKPPEDDEEKTAFSGRELGAILRKATEMRFGDTKRSKFHAQALWALKVLIWTGARPGEILQLQRGDVTEVDGVRILIVRKVCANAGERHPRKSLKNKNSRRTVPLHPAIAGFFDYAKASPTDFVFECFPWNKTKGRRGWWDKEFAPFIRDTCGIVAKPGEKLSLGSIRNTFHNAMDDAGIGDKPQRVLTGHAPPDIHEKYKRGVELLRLAGAMARIDPLRDHSGEPA